MLYPYASFKLPHYCFNLHLTSIYALNLLASPWYSLYFLINRRISKK